jgi:hypothetical protein
MSPHSFIICALLVSALSSAPQQPPPQGLRIVVIEGEDAVNVIQQKTAVRPVIEVRDRNNLPVSGVTVTFAIQGGQAATFAGGASTFSVVTNAAGQATAAAINPLASGAMQIQVQAVLQGQTALATIAQTNVMTVAQAAAVGGANAGGTAGASGAAGGGGGIPNTVLVGAGGAAVGAAALVLATKDEEIAPPAGPPLTISAGPITSGLQDVTQFEFTSSGTDAAKSYSWDFGDGETAVGTTARHVFSRTGTFQVLLRADGAPTTSASLAITVGTLTGRWVAPRAAGTFEMIITQSGNRVAGLFNVNWNPGSGFNSSSSSLDGTLSHPRDGVLFQRGECFRTLTFTLDASLNTLTGQDSFGPNAIGCGVANFIAPFSRQ